MNFFYSAMSKIIDTYREFIYLDFKKNEKQYQYHLDLKKDNQIENANLRTENAYRKLEAFAEKITGKIFNFHQNRISDIKEHHAEVSALNQDRINDTKEHHAEVDALHRERANEFKEHHAEVSALNQDRINDTKEHHAEVDALHRERANEFKEHHAEVTTLYHNSIIDTKEHHKEVMAMTQNNIQFSLALLKLVIEQKDETLERVLSILSEIFSNGENHFSSLEDYTQKMNVIDDGLKLLDEQCTKIKKEIIILDHELNKLRSQFEQEEASYKTIFRLKSKLSKEEYNYERVTSLLSSLEVADKINEHEISLIEKKHDETCVKEKYYLVKQIRDNIKQKKYRDLYSIKSSLNTAKIFAQMALPYQETLAQIPKQCYTANAPQQNPSYDIALEDLFKTTEKLKIHVDPEIDIHDLIEQTHDTEI